MQTRARLAAILSFTSAIVCASLGFAGEQTAIFQMNVDGSNVRPLARIEGHQQHRAPRWSHDGKRLAFEAAQDADGPWKLFSLGHDGGQLVELGRGSDADWSPDDKQLAYSIDDKGTAQKSVWVRNAGGRGAQRLAAGSAPRWSPDGGRLAVLRDGNLVIIDLVIGDEAPLFTESIGQVQAGFDWSPDGKKLALVATHQGMRRLWIVDSEKPNDTQVARLEGNVDGYLSWSPDARKLAVVLDGQIALLAVEGTAPPELIPGQHGKNHHPAWSPDGLRIAFVSDRQAADFAAQPAPSHRWRLEETARYRPGTIVYSLVFTPDGRRVVMGCDPMNHGVHVLDLASGEISNLGGKGIRVSMFPDGRRFATGWHSPIIQIVDINSGDVLAEMAHGPANIRALAVSPDGRRLVSGGLDHLLHVWDPNTGNLLTTFDKHQDWITHAVFSPDGREVISADHGKIVRVWNARTGKQRLELRHRSSVWSVAVSPDGSYILTGTGGSVATSPEALKIVPGTDNSVRIWDASRGRLLREMKGHTDAAYSLDVSPDGRLAASGGWDGSIRLWDLQTGRQLSVVDDGEGRAPRVVFSPDGKHLMVGGGGRRIGRRIVEFPNEQIRLYRLVEQSDRTTDTQSTKPGPESGK